MLQIFIDTFVQRLGDAAAAGLYEAIGIVLPIKPSTVAICALPVIIHHPHSSLALIHNHSCTNIWVKFRNTPLFFFVSPKVFPECSPKERKKG